MTDLPELQEWWTGPELVRAKFRSFPVSNQTANERLKKIRGKRSSTGEALARRRFGKRGGGWEYHLSALPAELKAEIIKRAMLELRERAPVAPKLPPRTRDEFERMPPKARADAHYRMRVLMEVEAYLDRGFTVRAAVEAVAETIKEGPSSIFAWRKMVAGLERIEWLPNLASNHKGKAGKRAPCTPAAWEAIKADYLRLEKPTFTSCYRRRKLLAGTHGWVIPSERALWERMKRDVKHATKVLYREGIIPASMDIEFVESKITGSSLTLYKERSDWLDQQISKAVLGQTTTTDAISGGHAVSQEHRQVQEDIERADAKAISGTLNRDLVRPWIDLEFGPQKLYPRIVIARPEQKDVKLIVESVEKLVPLGLKVSVATMQALLALPETEAGDELLGATTPAPDQPMPAAQVSLQAAESGAETVAEQLAKDAADIAEAPATAMIDTVRTLLDEVKTLEEFRDRLLKLDQSMSEADLAEALRLAMVWAELTGETELA